ncbi:MAG: fumarylacetoacetate hydrolase family protein [Dysgonamonadaceae bacterium]|jgi:2-keto-4-pentenoate hydratase/2-oxohepta-3-ene-1,7-dioic acid hydratase in catechol pathway|nr:fumarylacetoacetate hydrolase family protein [Dysgonamonadaceae bacterium]
MKIICVGMNYASHNNEMNHAFLKEDDPVIFLKSDVSLLKSGKPFYIPDFSEEIHYETEIVVRINRLGKNIALQFAGRYYDAVTVGIDFTARDLQRRLRNEGKPWEISKAFDNSAVIGQFIPLQSQEEVNNISFRSCINGNCVQQANTNEMIFKVDDIIAYVSRFFTLKMGDLIFTGTPSGVGRVKINDHIEGYIEGKKLLDFYVK